MVTFTPRRTRPVHLVPGHSEGDSVPALKLQHCPRVSGRSNIEREFLEDGPDFAHLLGVAPRQAAGTKVDAVLKPDPDIAAHGDANSSKRDLVPSCRQDRPLVVAAEEMVSSAAHMQQVLGARSDTPEYAEYSL